MKTLIALFHITLVILLSIPLLPIAFILDTIDGVRKYTFGSMFMDVGFIVYDIWINRKEL